MKLQETDSTTQMPVYDLSIVLGGKRTNPLSHDGGYKSKQSLQLVVSFRENTP